MAIKFAESSGQYHFNGTVAGPGVWQSTSATQSSSLPTYNGSTYGYGNTNFSMTSPNLGSFTTLYAGFRCYMATGATGPLITFLDSGGNEQCSLRINSNGTLFFSRNGTQIGSTSVFQVTYATWNYIEFKAILSTSATGTCEVRINSTVQLTATSVQNATTTNTAAAVKFQSASGTTPTGGADFYVVDTSGSINTSYLGDVTVAEIYLNGAGVNSAWAANPAASFSLTAAATASGGTTQYTGTITGGASNAMQGIYFSVTGFTNSANNGGPWLCTASSATTITLQNASGVSETHAGTCSFQNNAQWGIHGGVVDGYATTNVGTRPNGDVSYYADSTTNDKSDFAHQALALTGNIAGVVHVTYARKDDSGTRQIQQMCLSAGTEEDGATIGLNTTYQYYQDILEVDPHTSATWTLTNFNNATFGWKEIT